MIASTCSRNAAVPFGSTALLSSQRATCRSSMLRRIMIHHSQSMPSLSTATSIPSATGSHSLRFLSSSMTASSANNKPYSVAIVGTGPSGFYTAKYLMNAFDKKAKQDEEQACHIQIDMLERLPTPYGLVRYGVAPDHPEVKNVENDFAQLLNDANNSDDGDDDTGSRLQFWGNVTVGGGKDNDDSSAHITLEELRNWYDVVVLAYGCESDRKLGLPNETELKGILSAREFVAWYNGHPYFEHIGHQVRQALSSSDNSDNNSNNNKPTEVVVIGQGNVALDCARILAKGGQGLVDTDIASRALDVIGPQGVPVVTVVGRRGHVQGAFTIKELRELTKLDEEGYGAKFVVRQDELDLGETPASKQELEQKGARPKVRINKLLQDAAVQTTADNSESTKKEVRLRFLLSPKEFQASESDPSRVGSVICERTQLEGEPGQQRAVGTGRLETLPADLVLVSIGYKGTPVPGLEPWFDEQRGVVQNQGGKVDSASNDKGGLYVSGWLKRGPSGIIGTNIMDAKDTVINIVRDIFDADTDAPQGKPDAREKLQTTLEERKIPVVQWSNFQKIDAKETSAAQTRTEKQPREKITDLKELLKAAGVSTTE